MMREFGIVGASIWQSRKFRGLDSDTARLVYFYLHTSRHGNSAGAFVLPPEMAALDMKISAEIARGSFLDLQRVGLIRYEPSEELVQIRNFYRFNKVSSRKHLQGPLRIIHSLPICMVRDFAAADLVMEIIDRASDWQDKAKRYANSQSKTDQADAVKIAEAVTGFHQEASDLVRDLELVPVLSSADMGLTDRQRSAVEIALLIPLSNTPIDTPRHITDTETDTDTTTIKTTETDKITTTTTDTERESEREGAESGLPASPLDSGRASRTIPPDLAATIDGLRQAAKPGKTS